jgi:hypothetical protein
MHEKQMPERRSRAAEIVVAAALLIVTIYILGCPRCRRAASAGIGSLSTKLTNVTRTLLCCSIQSASVVLTCSNSILRLAPHLGFTFVRFFMAHYGL